MHHKEILKNLQTLKKLDSQRAGYYSDLITKWSIEQQLPQDYNNNSMEFKITFGEKITSLPHLQYYSFCQVVNLSNQELTSRILPTLIKLQHCKVLDLSFNKITTTQEFPSIKIEELHLENNKELNMVQIETLKDTCKFIKIFL